MKTQSICKNIRCIYHMYKADRVLKNTENSPKWWILHGNKCVKHWLVKVKNMMYKLPIQRCCSGQKHKVYTKICDAYTTYTRVAEWQKNTKNSPKWWILHGNKCVKHWLVQVKNMMYKRPIQRCCSGQKHKVYRKMCDTYTTYTEVAEWPKT
jgi:hypothetical protein